MREPFATATRLKLTALYLMGLLHAWGAETLTSFCTVTSSMESLYERNNKCLHSTHKFATHGGIRWLVYWRNHLFLTLSWCEASSSYEDCVDRFLQRILYRTEAGLGLELSTCADSSLLAAHHQQYLQEKNAGKILWQAQSMSARDGQSKYFSMPKIDGQCHLANISWIGGVKLEF